MNQSSVTQQQNYIPAHLAGFFADNDNWESGKQEAVDWGRKAIERLNELYVYDEKSGRLISRRTGCFLKGRVRTSSKKEGANKYRTHNVYLEAGYQKTMFEHRMVWAMVHGAWPALDLDHIDGDTLNNRRENLRQVDVTTNCRNKTMSRNNTTGITGVVIHKRSGRWQAQSTIQRGQKRKMVYLGVFDNLFDAAAARKSYELHHGFSERHGQPARSAA